MVESARRKPTLGTCTSTVVRMWSIPAISARVLADPQKLYLKLSPDQRRQMNLAIFEKL
jgi:type II secretory pathway component PulL